MEAFEAHGVPAENIDVSSGMAALRAVCDVPATCLHHAHRGRGLSQPPCVHADCLGAWQFRAARGRQGHGQVRQVRLCGVHRRRGECAAPPPCAHGHVHAEGFGSIRPSTVKALSMHDPCVLRMSRLAPAICTTLRAAAASSASCGVHEHERSPPCTLHACVLQIQGATAHFDAVVSGVTGGVLSASTDSGESACMQRMRTAWELLTWNARRHGPGLQVPYGGCVAWRCCKGALTPCHAASAPPAATGTASGRAGAVSGQPLLAACRRASGVWRAHNRHP